MFEVHRKAELRTYIHEINEPQLVFSVLWILKHWHGASQHKWRNIRIDVTGGGDTCTIS